MARAHGPGRGLRSHHSGQPVRKRSYRPAILELEDRCLLNAAGWFEAPWRAYAAGHFPYVGQNVMAVGDMDADGDPDVVAGSGYFASPGLPARLGGLSVLKNRGDGRYDAPLFVRLPQNDELHDVALADMDADGDLDALATVYNGNPLRNNVVLFRNQGNGTLAPQAQTFATGRYPMGLAVGDFTGDGFPDVVTADHALTENVSLLRHNGQTGPAAGLLAPVAFRVGLWPQGVAAADLNGDGRLDLAVARAFSVGQYPSGLSVLLNDGAGGFLPFTEYVTLPGAYLSSPHVALADVDNDGDHDLVSGGWFYGGGTDDTSAITVRRNAGDGTFGPAQVYAAPAYRGAYVWHFATGDLNGDGFLDVAAATWFDDTSDGYLVMLGNGLGGFQTPAFYEAALGTYAVAVADADRDGDRDVLTLSFHAAVVTVHRNPGTGVFPVPAAHSIGYLLDGFDTADIDRDGDRDVVVNQWLPVPREFAVVIMKNNGDGTFFSFQYIPPQDMRDLKLRDLNGDGYVDLLLVGENYSPSFMTAMNNGDGTFAAAIVWNAGACGAGTIDAFDLDHDGDRDVVLADNCVGTSGLRVFRNDGAGFFSPAAVLTHIGASWGVGTADLNHDGFLDLVTGGICNTGCTLTGMAVYLGNGNLTFRAPLIQARESRTYHLADFNRDGHVDLAMLAADLYIPTVLVGVALGNGDGTFRPPALVRDATTYGTGTVFSRTLEVGDINGDTFLDLVVTNTSGDDISLLRGTGDGSFAAPQHYGTGYYQPWFSALGDFTGDGNPDVASAAYLPRSGGFFSESILVVLRGRPDPDAPADVVRAPGRAGPGFDLGSWPEVPGQMSAPLSLVDTQSPRVAGGEAVSIGREMIDRGSISPSSDGWYNPVADTWPQTRTANQPRWRNNHKLFRTGQIMIVWGGVIETAIGGRYCALARPQPMPLLPLP